MHWLSHGYFKEYEFMNSKCSRGTSGSPFDQRIQVTINTTIWAGAAIRNPFAGLDWPTG